MKVAAKKGLLLAVIVMPIAALIRADEDGLLLLACGALAISAVLDARPKWLLRSPLGRWLRR